MTLIDRLAGRRQERIVCSVDIEHSFDSLHAHAIPEDVTLYPGDRVIVHGVPADVKLGEVVAMTAEATIIRAGWFDRMFTQVASAFELVELYHVGFEPAGFTDEALKPVGGG
jgi:hypothetical protein